MVGGRSEEARANLVEARAAAARSGDANAAFMLNLAEGGLEVVAGRFEAALEFTEAAARAGSATHDYARERLTQEWRCELMTVLDRVEESVELTADGIAAARRDRQAWALHIFETWRGRQLLQLGESQDAAAILEGQFSPEQEDRHESILDVAAGRCARTRRAPRRRCAPAAKDGRVRAGDARGRALRAFAGKPRGYSRSRRWRRATPGARAWLCALGEEERKSILPLFPVEVTDDAAPGSHRDRHRRHELAASAAGGAELRAELNPGARPSRRPRPTRAAC